MRYATLFAASALLALACGSAQAQWKWRDASGRVTASDLPPPASVPEQNIIAKPSDAKRASAAASLAPAPMSAVLSSAVGKAPAAAVPNKNSADPELEARRKRAAEELAAQQRQAEASNAAIRADNCARAKSYFGALSEGKRVGRTNAQGEVEVVDDQGRAEELQRARSTIASECK
jgi:Domain of unknown function (DUF4124)